MFEIYMALYALSKDFVAYISGRYTPIEMEKIHLDQDVFFGTWDIDMHRLTFTIIFVCSCIFKYLHTYSLNMPVLCLFVF